MCASAFYLCLKRSVYFTLSCAHTHSNTHKQQDLVTADTAAQQLEVKLTRSEQDKNLLQQQLDRMSTVRYFLTRSYCFVLLGKCSSEEHMTVNR